MTNRDDHNPLANHEYEPDSNVEEKEKNEDIDKNANDQQHTQNNLDYNGDGSINTAWDVMDELR